MSRIKLAARARMLAFLDLAGPLSREQRQIAVKFYRLRAFLEAVRQKGKVA